MYLDFEDRPDTPRLPPALSRLERVLIAAVLYLSIIVIYLVVPDSFWQAHLSPQSPPAAVDAPIRFVRIEPNMDRLAKPKPVAPPSDLDRRATAPEPIPKPETDAPKSVGDTPEKVTAPPPAPPPDAN